MTNLIIIYHVIFLFFYNIKNFLEVGEPYHFIVIIPSKKSAKSMGNCQVLKY